MSVASICPAWNTRTRDDDSECAQALGNRRGRQVPAAESKRQVNLLDGCIEIAAGCHDDPPFRDHEGPVKLRQFFHRSAEIGIADVCPCRGMARQSVENERARRREYLVCFTNGEQRSNAATLSPLSGDLECEFRGRLENGGLAQGNPRAQSLERGDRHRVTAQAKPKTRVLSMIGPPKLFLDACDDRASLIAEWRASWERGS
jgi:hypothetical protein